MYGGFGMCWYWPLVISRSTQPTDALLIATITSRGPSVAGSGAAIGSSDACCAIAAADLAELGDHDAMAVGEHAVNVSPQLA